MIDNVDDTLFLLDPDYTDFKPGKSHVKFESLTEGNGCLAAFAFFLLIAMLGWLGLIASSILSNTVRDGSALVLGVFMMVCGGSIAIIGVFLSGWVLVQYLRGVFHHRRLNKYALILDGDIIEARWRTEDRLEKFHVRYGFTAPDGKTCYGRQQRHRPDLKDKALPEAGTPVHILYVDQWTYLML
jgi:hypothetical protein